MDIINQANINTSELLDKPICKFGEKCYRKNAEHLNSYSHGPQQTDSDSKENNKPVPTENKKLDEEEVSDKKGPKITAEEKSLDEKLFDEKQVIEKRRDSFDKNPSKKRKISTEDAEKNCEKIDLAKVESIKHFFSR